MDMVLEGELMLLTDFQLLLIWQDVNQCVKMKTNANFSHGLVKHVT
jgi:hypothetical protein